MDKYEKHNEDIQFVEQCMLETMETIQDNIERIQALRDILSEVTFEKGNEDSYCTVFDYMDFTEAFLLQALNPIRNAIEDIQDINFEENVELTAADKFLWKPSDKFKLIPPQKRSSDE